MTSRPKARLKRSPIKRTDRRVRRKKLGLDHPEYKAWIATLPCVVCGRRPVEVAHVGDRGLGQKCTDRETIPLCIDHHRSGWTSHHTLGKRFWLHHSLDKVNLIREYQAEYETLQQMAA